MIVSLVEETDWLAQLKDIAPLKPLTSPALLIAPHPDDETLGAGGLIAALRDRGTSVTVVAVTDGENAYEGVSGLGEVRAREQACALERLGVDSAHTLRLQLPDRNVASHEPELVERLSPLVSSETCLIAPWRGDFHPDHEACGRAAEAVAEATGARIVSYFFWTWHFGTPDTIRHLPLRRFALDRQQQVAKAEALRCHRSQLEWENGEPILPERLLGPATRSFETFLAER